MPGVLQSASHQNVTPAMLYAVGLMMLAAAKAFSASSVAITDIRPDNLTVALQLGAQHALDQSQAKSSAETVETIMAVFPEGPDIVIDCVGMSSTITVSRTANHCYTPFPMVWRHTRCSF